MREGRTLLDEMIGQKPESTLLGEDGGLIMNRSVLKTKYQQVGYATTTRDLAQVASRKGSPLQWL